MNYLAQQQLLSFVKEIASGNIAACTLQDRSKIVNRAKEIVADAEKGGTIRDAINDTKNRFGHYANGIYIMEQALIESTVGRGGFCYVKKAHSLGEPISVCASEGFQKAREADDRALISFLNRNQ